MPKKPVKFEVPRDEQLKLAEEELKAAMMSFVRGDVHAMLFKDFKAHIQAMEHLETALAESPECVPGNLDLLLRWVVLRFCEQTPNTQSLLRVLDFTTEALGVAKDQGVRLTEQEGALFLPALVDKCGHSMEAVREKFRKILRLIPGVYPASRLCGYLVRGLDSKNSKTRLEVLEILESLMERHGLDVVERGGNKALAEIVKLVEARDAAMRAAASAASSSPTRWAARTRGNTSVAWADRCATRWKTSSPRRRRRWTERTKADRGRGSRTDASSAEEPASRTPPSAPSPSQPRSWARLRRDPSPRPVASPRLPRPWDRPSPPPQPPCSDPSARRCPPSSRDEETPRKRPTRPSLSRQPRRCPRRIELWVGLARWAPWRA